MTPTCENSQCSQWHSPFQRPGDPGAAPGSLENRHCSAWHLRSQTEEKVGETYLSTSGKISPFINVDHHKENVLWRRFLLLHQPMGQQHGLNQKTIILRRWIYRNPRIGIAPKWRQVRWQGLLVFNYANCVDVAIFMKNWQYDCRFQPLAPATHPQSLQVTGWCASSASYLRQGHVVNGAYQ